MKKTFILFIVLLSPFWLFAQGRTMSGKVADAQGNPLPGVTVVVKGTENGTTTNAEGRFTLSSVKTGDVLDFTFIGFQSQAITVRNQSEVTVTLSPSQQSLNQVVVTALGIQQQARQIGYSTQTVSGAVLNESHQTNLVDALQGRVAGVTITSSGGGPGQGASIIIRGVNSLSTDQDVNQPLFVIDGIPIDNSTSYQGTTGGRGAMMPNRISDLNPEDIASVTVLRGGAATALYGLRGANGVIVITTKKAKAGTFRVNYSATYGIDQVDKLPTVQNIYTQGYDGVYDSSSFWPEWGPTVAKARLEDPTHPAELYNQYGRAYINGNHFQNSISMSGGTEKSSLSSSLSYSNQNGTIPFTWYRKIDARLNGSLKLSDKLTVTPMIYYMNTSGNFYDANRFNEDMTYWSPRWDVRNYIKPDGTELTYGNDNPWYTAATNKFEDKLNRVIASTDINYDVLSWLSVNYRVGTDYYMDARTAFAPGPKGVPGEYIEYDNGLNGDGMGFISEFTHAYRQINSNLMLSLNRTWGGKFNTTLRLGHELLDRNEKEVAAVGGDLAVYNLFNLGNASIQQTNENVVQYRIVSLYGELTMGYNNNLFLTLTGRNDWTSSLEKGFNSFFYPSASLSYIFSDALKSSMPDWLSSGKLRGSVAGIGKDAPPYSTSIDYVPDGLPINGVTLWTQNHAAGVRDLKPEFTTTYELGTDLGFLQDRLGLSFTWYHSVSKDQILAVQTAASTGFTSITLNAGAIQNKGVELSVHATPVKTTNFSWDIAVNFSANKNKVLSIYHGLGSLVIGSEFGYGGSSPTFKYVVGQPVSDIFGTYIERYYGSGKTGDSLFTDKSKPMIIGSNGFPKRAPQSDQKILGNSQPKWIGSINNSLTFKNWNLSFLIDTRQGLQKYNQLDNFMSAFGIAKYTENRDKTIVFPGALADGAPNTKPVYLGQGTGPDGVHYGAGYYRNVYRGVTENFVQNANWVRLRSLSLSYNLPQRWLKHAFMSRASVSFTGYNLWLNTPYNGFDPEASDAAAGDPTASMMAGFTYPENRSYMFSVNVTF